MCLCSQDGWTALHLAAHEDRVDVVRLLTEAQAQVNIQTEVYIVVRSHLLRQNATKLELSIDSAVHADSARRVARVYLKGGQKHSKKDSSFSMK